MPKYNNELSGNVNEREMRDFKKIWKKWYKPNKALMLNKGKRPKVVLERGCSSFLEKEREMVRERKRIGG